MKQDMKNLLRCFGELSRGEGQPPERFPNGIHKADNVVVLLFDSETRGRRRWKRRRLVDWLCG